MTSGKCRKFADTINYLFFLQEKAIFYFRRIKRPALLKSNAREKNYLTLISRFTRFFRDLVLQTSARTYFTTVILQR